MSAPQDRSPKYPRLSLENAVARARSIYEQAGKASIAADTVAKVLGYTNAMNGKAQAIFSTLGQYGLLLRERKEGKFSVSPLTIKILHPVNEEQRLEALRTAALSPSIFSEIYAEFSACSEAVLSSHLVQKGFTPEGASTAAAVYKANAIMAKLDSSSVEGVEHNDDLEYGESNEPPVIKPVERTLAEQAPNKNISPTAIPLSLADTEKLLAQYSIPLGANSAKLIFTGEELLPDDFDALIEYVELFKKQFERKLTRNVSLTAPADLSQVSPPQHKVDLTSLANVAPSFDD